jgi:hypothetical protein
MVWTNPSSRPHPPKRRFAQGRRDSTAVQILSPDFLGLSNYKAIVVSGHECKGEMFQQLPSGNGRPV